MTWSQAILEYVKAVFGLITGLAWPVVIALIVWWFRKEIRDLFPRLAKFEALGVKMETTTQLLLENTKAALPEETIQQIKTVLETGVKVAASGSIKGEVEGLNVLMELTVTDPRAAIKRSWELLAKAIFRAANVSSENLEPNSEELSFSLRRLEANNQFPERLIRSIRNLQEIARKVFYHSQWAFMPSQPEASDYVLYSAGARSDLGEKIEK